MNYQHINPGETQVPSLQHFPPDIGQHPYDVDEK